MVEVVDERADPGLGRGDRGRAFDEERTRIGHTLFSCGKGGAPSRECATVTGHYASTTRQRAAATVHPFRANPAPPRTARPCEPDGRRLSVAGPKRALTGVLPKPAAAGALAESGTVRLDGDRVALTELAALLDEFDPSFPIVTP
ncbi:alkyl sulfatase C-terminal domain-containing protein [Nocardia testacea]|uniref:alkyl sulfatase C-terminal domain-containing protein n=1 Tax=Nocardia testacea TaxID=248551 RepID=UPI003C2F412A